MPAGAVRAALDLGDDSHAPGELNLLDDPAAELAADDREMTELGAAGSSPDASSSASRADVPLPQGERSTSPSAKTVTLRCVSA